MVSYAWGGQRNGYIPTSALKYTSGGLLRADAADAFDLMAAAFRRQFGKNLTMSEGYRDYATQVEMKAYWTRQGKPGNAAAPGGSIHGWALAVDIDLTGLSQQQVNWLHNEGRAFGYNWETTGRPTGEPWHLDFNLPVTASGGGADPINNVIARKAKMYTVLRFDDTGACVLWNFAPGQDGRRATPVATEVDLDRLVRAFGMTHFDSQNEWEIIRKRYNLGN